MAGGNDNDRERAAVLKEFERSQRQLEFWQALRFISTSLGAIALVVTAGFVMLTLSGAEGHPGPSAIEVLLGEFDSPDAPGNWIPALLLFATIIGVALAGTGKVLFSEDRDFDRVAHRMRTSAALSSARARVELKTGKNLEVLFRENPNLTGANGGEDRNRSPTSQNARPTDYLDILTQFRERMWAESRRLQTNSRVNLIWGIIFSVLAMIFLLVSIVFAPHIETTNIMDFLSAYGPRSALAAILELVSFFFLRLYSTTEYEIKHHKNEVTNMEAKFAAALYAGGTTVSGRLAVAKSLAGVERNFIIKKGERTVVSEIDTQYNDFTNLLEKMGAVLASVERK